MAKAFEMENKVVGDSEYVDFLDSRHVILAFGAKPLITTAEHLLLLENAETVVNCSVHS